MRKRIKRINRRYTPSLRDAIENMVVKLITSKINSSSHPYVSLKYIEELLLGMPEFLDLCEQLDKEGREDIGKDHAGKIVTIIDSLVEKKVLTKTWKTEKVSGKPFPMVRPYDTQRDIRSNRSRSYADFSALRGHFRPQTKKVIGTLLMIIVAAIIVVLLCYRPSPNPTPPIVIEKNDEAFLYYTVWASDQTNEINFTSPYFDDTFWIHVVSIVDGAPGGLILGLYNNLLGKEESYRSRIIKLNPCVDQNFDGIDDNTGEPALSYGLPSHVMFGKYIAIRFEVLSIKKPT